MSGVYVMARLNLKYGAVAEFDGVMHYLVPIFEEVGGSCRRPIDR
jgi:hypothetical protein